jgi:hypothetical protein
MADSRDGWRGTPNKTGWKAITTWDVQEPQPAPDTAHALQKKDFLQKIFAHDPTELLQWHATRPEPDQERFVKVLDGLYNTYKGKKPKVRRSGAARIPQARSAPSLAEVPEDEALHGSDAGRGGIGAYGSETAGDATSAFGDDRSVGSRRSAQSLQSLQSSKSAPNLKPIDIFNASQRARARNPVAGDNSLQRWIEQRVGTPQSVSTDWTNPSQMTRTSVGTVQSAPCSKYTLDFRKHARGMAINRRKWKVPDAHEPQAELVKDGMPEERRLRTNYGMTFGVESKGSSMRKETAYDGFKPEVHNVLENFLAGASPQEKEDFTQVGRSLYTYKTQKQFSTTTARAYDLDRNKLLWNPGKATPVVQNPYRSSVPLGNLNNVGGEPPAYPPEKPIPDVNLPPCFSVSVTNPDGGTVTADHRGC